MLNDYFKIAWRNLKNRKMRSALTIIGIFVSIAILFLLVSLSLGLQDAVNNEFHQLGSDKFYISPENSLAAIGRELNNPLTTDDADSIENVRGVKSVGYTCLSKSKVEFGNEFRFYNVLASPLEDDEVIEMLTETSGAEPDKGRLLKKGDKRKAILGSEYSVIFKRPVEPGHKIKINGYEFRVIGIAKPQGISIKDTAVSIPYEDFTEIFDRGNSVDTIIVQIDEGIEMQSIFEDVKRTLRHFRNVERGDEDFTIINPQNLIDKLNIILNIITIFLLSVAGVSLIVGGIGIANTMYTSITERTKDIGIMKSIGAKNSDILKIFLVESGILGIMGGVIGIGVGYGLSQLIELLVKNSLRAGVFYAQNPWWLIIGALCFSFLVGTISGIFPSQKAAKINAVKALHYE